MSSPQLAEIEASLLSVVRQAYDLGRSDALKKVFAAVNGDREPLALMAPASASRPGSGQSESETDQHGHGPTDGSGQTSFSNGAQRSADAPWWAYPVR